MLEFHQNQVVSNPHRVKIFDDKTLVMYSIQSYAFFLDCNQQLLVHDDHFVGMIQSELDFI